MNKICLRCKKIQGEINQHGYCEACHFKEMQEFGMIKNYVYTHPNCTIIDVINYTGLDLKVVERAIQYGGISIIDRRNT